MFRLGDEESIQRHDSERRETSAIMDNEIYVNDYNKRRKNIMDGVNENLIPCESDVIFDPLSRFPSDNVKLGEVLMLELKRNNNDEMCIFEDKVNNMYVLGKNGKKGISIRNRKLIKKYGSLDAAEKVLMQQRKN